MKQKYRHQKHHRRLSVWKRDSRARWLRLLLTYLCKTMPCMFLISSKGVICLASVSHNQVSETASGYCLSLSLRMRDPMCDPPWLPSETPLLAKHITKRRSSALGRPKEPLTSYPAVCSAINGLSPSCRLVDIYNIECLVAENITDSLFLYIFLLILASL